MITLNHTINLVTEIDEKKMPDKLLNVFVNLSEIEMETMLRQTFISVLENQDFLNTINEGNSWAKVKIGNN